MAGSFGAFNNDLNFFNQRNQLAVQERGQDVDVFAQLLADQLARDQLSQRADLTREGFGSAANLQRQRLDHDTMSQMNRDVTQAARDEAAREFAKGQTVAAQEFQAKESGLDRGLRREGMDTQVAEGQKDRDLKTSLFDKNVAAEADAASKQREFVKGEKGLDRQHETAQTAARIAAQKAIQAAELGYRQQQAEIDNAFKERRISGEEAEQMRRMAKDEYQKTVTSQQLQHEQQRIGISRETVRAQAMAAQAKAADANAAEAIAKAIEGRKQK